MINDRIAQLIARKLAGEVTDSDISELEQWMQLHPEDQFLMDLMLSYWQSKRPFIDAGDNDEHFAKIIQKAEQQPVVTAAEPLNRIGSYKWIRVAAVIAGLVALLIGYSIVTHKSDSLPGKLSQVTASPGTKSQLLLPDGTKVWLNAGSTIDFDKNFQGSLREVYLEGEAYFDVVKDAKRPFIVHTSGIDIKVLGTAFNVASYKEDSTVEATLIHGLIEITQKAAAGKKILLYPNQKYIYDKNAVKRSSAINTGINVYKIVPATVNMMDSSVRETAWIYNRLQFDGDTFGELAVKLERWFNIEVSIKSEEVAQYRLRGVFEDETIEQVLEALQLIAPFKYSISGSKIEITK